MKNLEMEDSVTAADDSFKARFLALGLDQDIVSLPSDIG